MIVHFKLSDNREERYCYSLIVRSLDGIDYIYVRNHSSSEYYLLCSLSSLVAIYPA